MALEIRVLKRGDENILTNVAADVFDNPVDAGLTREFLEDPRHHIAVAIDDGTVVGLPPQSTMFIRTNRLRCGSMKWRLRRPIAGKVSARPS